MPPAPLIGAAVATTVPWQFREGDGRALWSWQTSMFVAVIVRFEGHWLWEVSIPGPTVLGAGTGRDLDDCEFYVLETLGKAFHAGFRYARLCEHAAAHYTFSDGIRRDLTPLDGVHVIITLDDERVLAGILGIRDWWLHVTMGQRTVDVHPAHVRSIQPAFPW